ncbi:MAG TPA: hypothetical protein VL201_03040 [Patescibacteria group bacterium]|jgi:hypothetical protein|nr:hypothetical protein [Patescibacteria group bacterium]
MNKTIGTGVLLLSFLQAIPNNDHKEQFCLKIFTEKIEDIFKTLDTAFERILFYGDGEGYRTIEQAKLNLIVPVVSHDEGIQIQEIASFLNTQVALIMQFIQGRPTTKDKVLAYMMQFKNKINLIDLITACITQLNTVYQQLVQKGHKKDAARVRKLIIFASEIRSKWVNRSNSDPMKMLENLRNSLK